MRKIFISLLLLITVVINAQTYQINQYKLEQTRNHWTEWLSVSAQIRIDFESMIVTVEHEQSIFQFRIIEIGSQYGENGYRIVDILVIDLDQRQHYLTLFQTPSGGVFVQIDDFTEHKIIYKLR